MRLFEHFLDTAEPKAKSKVHGFTVSVEKKEGGMLTSRPKGQPEVETRPASENFYYEVIVQSTGENREYPKDENPMVNLFTVGLEEGASGYVGGVSYLPAGSRYTGFKIKEDIEDNLHSVPLHAYFKDASGAKGEMAIGDWTRTSEQSRWMAVKDCQAHCI